MKTKTPYWQKLQSPKWQKLRLEVLNRAGWKCQLCGKNDTMLAVHHPYYIAGRDPWEYPQENLMVLCKDCHEKEQPERHLYETPSGEIKEYVIPSPWEDFVSFVIPDSCNRSAIQWLDAANLFTNCDQLAKECGTDSSSILRTISAAIHHGLIDRESITVWKNEIDQIRNRIESVIGNQTEKSSNEQRNS